MAGVAQLAAVDRRLVGSDLRLAGGVGWAPRAKVHRRVVGSAQRRWFVEAGTGRGGGGGATAGAARGMGVVASWAACANATVVVLRSPGVFSHSRGDDRIKRYGHVGLGGWPRRRSRDMAGELLLEAVTGKRLTAGQTLIQHTRQRVDVGAGVDLTCTEPLRRHVMPGADRRAPGARQFGLAGGACNAEVDQIGEVISSTKMLDGLTSRWTSPTLDVPPAAPWPPAQRCGPPRRVQRTVGSAPLEVATLDEPHVYIKPASISP